jgi:hypothetical protein
VNPLLPTCNPVRVKVYVALSPGAIQVGFEGFAMILVIAEFAGVALMLITSVTVPVFCTTAVKIT